MSGPVSYNHAKLDKPIGFKPNNIKLVGVFEDTTLSPKATINCSGCVPPIAFIASRRMLFSATFGLQKTTNGQRIYGWSATENDHDNDLGELADPKTKFGIYVSGSGNKASMMKYKERWWIVFGSDTKCKMKRITLHVPTVEFSTKLLDEAADEFFDFIRGTVRNET